MLYVGVFGNDPLYETFLSWLLDQIGLRGVMASPPGVEVAERWHGGQRILFIMNHGKQAQTLDVGGTFTNLLDGGSITGPVTIAPLDVMVLQPPA